MYDIITIGEILVEVLAEHVGQVFYKPGTLLGPYPSGAPAIFIDQAARMGSKTAIVAKVGKDDFARLNRERLSGDGVDISHIAETDANSTGVAFVTYFDDGSRQFIFHFSKAACGELCSEDIDESVIKNSRYLHIMGCSITGSRTMGEAIMRSVRLAKSNGVKISFDPNIRPELLSGTIMEYYKEIIDECDLLLTGKSELRLLFDDCDVAISKLLKQKERIVVVKDGSHGTNVYTRAESFFAPAYSASEIDPTGAGDCFDATFLSGICSGLALRTAALRANAAGAKAVEKRGPMEGNTTVEELDKFIASCESPAITDISNPYNDYS
ncbi:MAG: sugar kinase [Oscillospiraceae bacterium]